jgi:hypothetical protein
MAQGKAMQIVDMSNPNADKIISASTTNAVISNKQSMTAVEWLVDNLPERFKNAIINTCIEEIKQANRMEKEQMICFHNWMMKNDTPENAERYFHYTDNDMLNEYLNQNNL